MNLEKILVVGFQPYDSGKTTLCKALVYGFKEIGIDFIPFKPHAGISYWNQFDVFQKCVRKGSLLSSDIMELEDAARSSIDLEILNPVNRLNMPVFDRGLPIEKLTFQEFIAERFTYCDNITHKDNYYLNGRMNFSKIRDLETFYVQIKKKAEKIKIIKKFNDLLEAYVNNFDISTSSSYNRIKKEHLLIESFNDAAYPFNKADDCNVILCALSNIVFQFDLKKYFRAIESIKNRKSKLQLTISDIYEPTLVKEKFPIKPLTKQEKDDPEKLTLNYSMIINKLKTYVR